MLFAEANEQSEYFCEGNTEIKKVDVDFRWLGKKKPQGFKLGLVDEKAQKVSC